MALLEKLNVTDEDTLIFDGDLVDRGKRIREVLGWVLNRKKEIPEKTRIVLGNHDISLIDWFNVGGVERNAFMYNQGLEDTLKQLWPNAREYASDLKKYGEDVIFSPDGKYVFCHADYNWAPNEKFNYEHYWTRIDKYTHANYKGPIIVHGHTPCMSKDIYLYNKDNELIAINLDGGAVYHERMKFACLRAFNAETGEITEQITLD